MKRRQILDVLTIKLATNGCIGMSVRSLSRNALICLAKYASCCPAKLGQSGLALMPFWPWQAAHMAAFVAPA